MLAVQLDTALSTKGSDASISRHTQGKEGEELLSLFPQGIKILDGGVKGALTSAKDTTEPKLYCVSGKRKFKISSVPVSGDSLNSRDGFVLDGGSEGLIVQWVNADASPALKFRTLDLADELEQEYHAGNAKVAIISPGEAATAESDKFYELLGIKDPASFKPAPPPADTPATGQAKLWAVEYTCDGFDTPCGWPLLEKDSEPRGDAGAMLDKSVLSQKVHAVSAAPSAYMLSADALIAVHSGATLWLWVGKGVPHELRRTIFSLADKIKFQNELPATCAVEVVKQGLEGPLLTQHFGDWDAAQLEAAGVAKVVAAKGGEAEAAVAAAPRAADFTALAQGAQEGAAMVDDGSGSKKVWRIEKFELAQVPAEKHGCFTSGDCYMVLYTYATTQGQEQHIVYMWQGADCTVDERGGCAACAVQIDEQHCGGAAPQVRVVQGKEPPHFVAMWQGAMVVYEGGVASGFKSLREEGEAGEADGATKAFQVRAAGKAPAYAVQVPAAAASLNSGDVFIVVTAEKAFTWQGQSSSDTERTTATSVAEKLLEGAAAREAVTVAEGEEGDEFWDALDGKGDYPKIPAVTVQQQPRLFCVSDTLSGGKEVATEEVLHFAQCDLLASEVMLLDTFAEVFVWIGAESSVNEQKQAQGAAEAYLAASKRSADTPVTTMKAGKEPPMFTAYFHGWEANKKVRTVADYDARVAALKAQQAASAPKTADAQPSWVKPDEPAPAEPAAGASDATPAAPGKLKNNIFVAVDSKEVPSNGTAVPATPTSAGATRRHGGISAQTPRGGNFEPSETDPSGTKGTGDPLKFKPGQDEIDIEQLKTMKGSDGIDPTCKEKYLSDAQFEELFSMGKDAFAGMPLWKRQQKKKAAGLF